jgi:hypothetical protein
VDPTATTIIARNNKLFIILHRSLRIFGSVVNALCAQPLCAAIKSGNLKLF